VILRPLALVAADSTVATLAVTPLAAATGTAAAATASTGTAATPPAAASASATLGAATPPATCTPSRPYCGRGRGACRRDLTVIRPTEDLAEDVLVAGSLQLRPRQHHLGRGVGCMHAVSVSAVPAFPPRPCSSRVGGLDTTTRAHAPL